MTDKQIIQQIREKSDEKAFAALYKHLPMIKKMVMSKGGTAEDAKDVFQDALIIVHRKIAAPDFQLTSKLSTYLFSVCRYLWKDKMRKAGKENSVRFDEAIDKAEENEIEELAEKENRIKVAEQVILELGERCRELLLLFYAGKTKLKEIARKMGYSSENTAKNQKYKCLETAKKKLLEIQQKNI